MKVFCSNMPKTKRDGSVSYENCRQSPASKEAMKEWEEARCPVCMEHPHNALVLICSSYEKGCRPYMCDTSYRHSNCFDQFCKSFPETPSTEGLELQSSIDLPNMRKLHEKLVCPLCRGQVLGCNVMESARGFMNMKPRSCACETCDFTGNYTEIRKHARVEHPLVRPSEADPERQRNWRRLERQRDIGDVISTIQSTFGEDENTVLPIEESNLLTVFLLIRVFRPGSSSRPPARYGIRTRPIPISAILNDRQEDRDRESLDDDPDVHTVVRRRITRSTPDDPL